MLTQNRMKGGSCCEKDYPYYDRKLLFVVGWKNIGPWRRVRYGLIVPHAITDVARDHMASVTSPATTVLLGRKNYEGFGGYWPSVADNQEADPRERAFSRWLNSVEKIVFSSTLTGTSWKNSSIK